MSWISDLNFPVVLLILELARRAEWAVDQAGNLGHSSIAFTSVIFWASSPKQKIEKNIKCQKSSL
jgi:hypothetical protein